MAGGARGGHGAPGTAAGLGGDAQRWREGIAARVVPPRSVGVPGGGGEGGLNCTRKCRALMVEGGLYCIPAVQRTDGGVGGCTVPIAVREIGLFRGCCIAPGAVQSIDGGGIAHKLCRVLRCYGGSCTAHKLCRVLHY